MAMTLEQCLAHIPERIPTEAKTYAVETALKDMRYIFVRRERGRQYGFCTYCKEDFETSGFGHNTQHRCPRCKSLCHVKQHGRSRKYLVHDAYFHYYAKSAVDPSALVAIGIYAVLDLTGDYRKAEVQYADASLFVFQPNVGGCVYRRWAGYYYSSGAIDTGKYWLANSISRGTNITPSAIRSDDIDSIKAAVEGTPYQYSTWEQYTVYDLPRFFDLYSRYKCIEYLTKVGFKRFVSAKLTGARTYGAINWRGNSLLDVLRLSKQELRSITNPAAIEPDALRLYQIGRKDGSKFTLEEAVKFADQLGYGYDDLMTCRAHASLREIRKYVTKQVRKERYKLVSDALRAYRDYLRDCVKLERDMSDSRILFPPDLVKAHAETIAQIKDKADELLRNGIATRAKMLSKYTMTYAGLMIRPLASPEEVVDEGTALKHCVGRYSEDYASGKTNLLVIRKVDEPGKPYYTVEIQNNIIRQCYGYNHRVATPEVNEFLKRFKEKHLHRAKKVNIEEVAV